jgi:SH3-like domain-containing protein
MAEGTGFINWQGGSPEAETYFVVVSPTGNATARYLLNISSPALTVDQPGAIALEPGAPIPTATPDPNIAVVTTNALNVRQGPSTAFPVIVTVPNGTELTVLGRDAANTWLSVQLEDGTEGWVTRSLTNYTLVAPTVLEAEPVSVPAPTGVTTTVTTTANLTAGVVITVAEPLNDEWQVLNPGATQWYSVQYRGGGLPVTIWMDAEPIEGALFNVVSADTALAIMNGTAPTLFNTLGRGRPNPVEPGYLFWSGDFPEADTLYVMVQNTGTEDIRYSVNALGSGVGRSILPAE